MEYFFFAVIFLSPLIPSYIFNKFIKEQENKLGLKFDDENKIRVGGIFAFYIATMLLVAYSLDPGLFRLNLAHEGTKWSFKIVPPSNAGQQPFSGELLFKNGALNSSVVTGYVNTKSGRQTIRPDSRALLETKTAFIDFFRADKIERYFLVGSFDIGLARNTLNVFRPASTSSSDVSAKGTPGVATFNRIYAWDKLIGSMVIPMIVMIILTSFGPIVASIALNIGLPNYFPNNVRGSFTLAIGGVPAAFLILISTFEFFWSGFPKTLNELDKSALASCQEMHPRWNFQFRHDYDNYPDSPMEFAGHINWSCKGINDVQIAGISNMLLSSRYNEKGDFNCYEEVFGGKNSFSWRAISVIITPQNFTLLYTSDEVGDNEKELGLLTGQLSNQSVHKWVFFDLSDNARKVGDVGRGELIAFRPGHARQASCADLASK